MMKIRLMLGLVVTGSLLVSANVYAKESANTNPYKIAFRDVPVLELPAKAAKMIKELQETERESGTIKIIAAVSEMKPAAVPAVVGTIARTTPAQAGTAAAAATQFQPELAITFVKSATTAAPKMAATIVKETCQRAPRQFPGIAITASQAAPSANLEILAAVSSAIPEVKPAIQQIMSATKTAEPSVDIVVREVPKITGPIFLTPTADPKYPTPAAAPPLSVETPVTTVTAAAGPIIGDPFKPLPGVPAEITPNGTVVVPPDRRDYAAP